MNNSTFCQRSKKQFILPILATSLLAGCINSEEQTIAASTAQPVDYIKSEQTLQINLVGRALLNAESPEGAAEIVQYHQATNRTYAINSSGKVATVDIIDLNNINPDLLQTNKEGVVTNSNLQVLGAIDLTKHSTGDANSIAISQSLNMLAVAIAAPEVGEKGVIAFYDISAEPKFIKNVQVGYLPDMVTFSPDSTKVVVANEGEPSGDYAIDPEGSISIINITGNTISDSAIDLNFNAFDDKQQQLASHGVMFANPSGRTIKGKKIQTTVSMDLEPEYVTVTEDSKLAYVSMQENNALAVVDLSTDSLVNVIGLGFKDWSNLNLDASDKDGGINFKQYKNLYGMYQPDTIATYRWSGANFIVTANEGDGREYFFDSENEQSCLAEGGLDYDKDDGCLAYTDESRVKKLKLDKAQFVGLKNDKTDIGRLKVSTVKGDRDNDGVYEELYTYGARSFTIWNEQGNVIYDSGDDVALITASIHGQAFNNDEDENEGDTRSDAKGAEPEALALGRVGEKTYAFVGLERMGGIMVYDVTNPFDVKFADYFYNRGTVEGEKVSGDLAPEGMKFIPATNNTAARLLVGNEVSGSVAVWEIALN